MHTLIKNGTSDNSTVIAEMFKCFKGHLRILNNFEDAGIKTYLKGAVDAIATYSDIDIFLTPYIVFTPEPYTYKSLNQWYCGKHNISNVVVLDPDGIDVTSDYLIDTEKGMFYPNPDPQTNTITFTAGFDHYDKIPSRLVTIIYRYGAELYEHRESSRIGDLKALPNWVEYSLASIWTARV